MSDFEGQVAVVTGAAGGIGRATARLFAARGARVLLADRDAAVEAVAEGLRAAGGQVEAVSLDVGDEPAVADLMRTAIDRFGRLASFMPMRGCRAAGRVCSNRRPRTGPVS